MRVVAALLGVFGVLGAAGYWYFFLQPSPEPVKRVDPDSIIELERPGVRAVDLDREVAPLLAAPGVKHSRARVSTSRASIELWGTAPQQLPAGAVVKTAPEARSRWLVRGDQRP